VPPFGGGIQDGGHGADARRRLVAPPPHQSTVEDLHRIRHAGLMPRGPGACKGFVGFTIL
jgi:hypothetical protein